MKSDFLDKTPLGRLIKQTWISADYLVGKYIEMIDSKDYSDFKSIKENAEKMHSGITGITEICKKLTDCFDPKVKSELPEDYTDELVELEKELFPKYSHRISEIHMKRMQLQKFNDTAIQELKKIVGDDNSELN